MAERKVRSVKSKMRLFEEQGPIGFGMRPPPREPTPALSRKDASLTNEDIEETSTERKKKRRSRRHTVSYGSGNTIPDELKRMEKEEQQQNITIAAYRTTRQRSGTVASPTARPAKPAPMAPKGIRRPVPKGKAPITRPLPAMAKALPNAPNRAPPQPKAQNKVLQGLKKEDVLTSSQKLRQYTQKGQFKQVVDELLSSEQSYLDYLTYALEEGQNKLLEQKLVTHDESNAIFMNLKTLKEFHSTFFHPSVLAATKDWSKSNIGAIFIEYASVFNLYKEYAKKYDLAQEKLHKVLKRRPVQFFQDKFSEQCNDTFKSPLRIADFLIMPIQRPLRLVLLLKQALKAMPETHSDVSDVTLALKQMEDVAKCIDRSRGDEERQRTGIKITDGIVDVPRGVEIVIPGRTMIDDFEAYLISVKHTLDVKIIIWNDAVLILQKMKKEKYHFLGLLLIKYLSTKKIASAIAYDKLGPGDGKHIDPSKCRHFIELSYYDKSCYILSFTKSSDQKRWKKTFDNAFRQVRNKVWTKTKAESFTARDGHSSTILERQLYVYGGNMQREVLGDLSVFSLESHSWEHFDIEVNGKPLCIAGHTSTIYNNVLYVFGGIYKDMQYSNAVYSIDLKTKVAMEIDVQGKKPAPRASHVAGGVNGKIYVYGGVCRTSDTEFLIYSGTWSFDIETATWEKLSDGPTGRKRHSCVVIEHEMYIFGGRSKESRDLNDMHVYDTIDDTWKSCTQFGWCPSPRSSAALDYMPSNGMIILFGGENDREFLQDLLVYSIKTKSWSRVTLSVELEPTSGHKMHVFNNSVFIVAGKRKDGTHSSAVIEVANMSTYISKGLRESYNDLDFKNKLVFGSANAGKSIKAHTKNIQSYSLAAIKQISRPINFEAKVHVDKDWKWDGHGVDLFDLVELLGSGGFGEVWRAKQKHTQIEIAVKKIENVSGTEKEQEKLNKEMEILKECSQFVNLVKYYGHARVENSTWILMEYCSAGSLKDILNLPLLLSEKQAAQVCAKTITGLALLHSKNIIHRDIKAANILLDRKGGVKLCDFGLAEHLGNLVGRKELSGSSYWMAPEIKKTFNYSVKSDIWALGITVIELLENTNPYSVLKKTKKYQKQTLDFIYKCLVDEPGNRPGAYELSQHTFVVNAKGPKVLEELIKQSKVITRRSMVRRARKTHRSRGSYSKEAKKVSRESSSGAGDSKSKEVSRESSGRSSKSKKEGGASKDSGSSSPNASDSLSMSLTVTEGALTSLKAEFEAYKKESAKMIEGLQQLTKQLVEKNQSLEHRLSLLEERKN